MAMPMGDDREVFEQCTDTIIRQVGDIGRMVDEFSSFARMPHAGHAARMRAGAFAASRVFLQRVAHPQITFETACAARLVYFECDGRLVSQALTNVLKNATEGIAARNAAGDDAPGRIARRPARRRSRRSSSRSRTTASACRRNIAIA